MKEKLRYIFFAIVGVIVIIAVFISAVSLYKTIYFDTFAAITDLSIQIVSLIISLVALLITLVTFFSIDSVNAISSMEGNLLCNPNYNVAYYSLVKDFDDCTTQSELEDKLFSILEKLFKKESKTCIKFADSMQHFIDLLLWMAYLDASTKKYNDSLLKIIAMMEDKYRKNEGMLNGGDSHTIAEHIKLIKNVLNYQSVAHEGNNLSADGKMLNIRGDMFKNNVSQTIFYDYLGLEYFKNVTDILVNIDGCDPKADLFLPTNLSVIDNSNVMDEYGERITLFLDGALDAFEQAAYYSQNDLLWKGYISFNHARVKLVKAIVNHSTDSEEWQEEMLSAIAARRKVLLMFCPDNKAEYSFLHTEFVKEYAYAKSMYFLMKKHYLELTDTEVEEVNVLAQSISDFSKERIFKRTNAYLYALKE